MSIDIIGIIENSENCINCKYSSSSCKGGFKCEYPNRFASFFLGRRPVRPNDWCNHFCAINQQKTR